MVRLLSTSNTQGVETMEKWNEEDFKMENKTIDEIRKDLEESGDVQLQAIARLDHDRLAKLADWIRSLDQKD